MRSVNPTKRFESLIEFLEQEKRLPKDKEKYKDVNNIGDFLYRILKGIGLKKYRDSWIKQMMDISEIRDEIKNRMQSYDKNENKNI